MSLNNPAKTAFAEFVAMLQATEQEFLNDRNQTDSVDLYDCYKNLFDLVAIGVDLYVDNDPAHPHFEKIVSPFRKMGGDCAHALYDFCPLLAGKKYRITGNVAGTIYMGFTLYGGEGEDDVDVDGNINTSHIHVDEAGNFEIILSPVETETHGATLLKTKAQTHSIIVRQYFATADRSNDAVLSITPLDPDEETSPLSAELMAKRITSLTRFLKGWRGLTPMPWPEDMAAYNMVCPPFTTGEATGHWSTPDNLHAFGFFKLKPNQALEITGRSPQCLYWSCHLWNACMHTFDYNNHPCAMVNTEVDYNDDGSWTLTIALNNKGYKNWISTAGREKGFIYFRWLDADKIPEALSCRLIEV